MEKRYRNDHRPLTRRAVLRLSGATLLGGLLSACQLPGVDDSEPEPTPTTGNAASAKDSPVDDPTATSTPQLEPSPTATDPPTTPTPTTAPTVTEMPASEPTTFRIVRPFPIVSMNPYVTAPGRDGLAARLCLEPLFEFDADLNPVLVLARTWPTIENGLLDPDLTWVIWELRDDVAWHDGECFTADDVLFTWEFAVESGVTFDAVESVEVLGDHRVRLDFGTTNPNWFEIYRGDTGVILPGHVYEPLTPTERMNWETEPNQTPIGTGPWHPVKLQPAGSGKAVFERAETYSRPRSTNIERIEMVWASFGGADVARQVLVHGEADWSSYAGIGDPDELGAIEQRTGKFATLPASSVERLIFNFVDSGSPEEPLPDTPAPHPVLSDRRVREAIALAVPRERIAALYGITGEPAHHMLPLHEHLPADPFPPQDVERARMLVRDAEQVGAQLRIHSTQATIRHRELELIAEALEEIGFVIGMRNINARVFFSSDIEHPDSYVRFEADMFVYTHSPGNAPYPLHWASRYRSDHFPPRETWPPDTNIARYSNSEYDRIHDQLAQETNLDKQTRLWSELLNILRADIVEVPLVHRHTVVAVGDRVRDWSLNPWARNPSWDLHNWRIEE